MFQLQSSGLFRLWIMYIQLWWLGGRVGALWCLLLQRKARDKMFFWDPRPSANQHPFLTNVFSVHRLYAVRTIYICLEGLKLISQVFHKMSIHTTTQPLPAPYNLPWLIYYEGNLIKWSPNCNILWDKFRKLTKRWPRKKRGILDVT